MWTIRFCIPGLLCLLAACRGDEAAAEKSAAPAQPAKQSAYEECMAAANRLPSRAETVIKASECMRLPDAPPPGFTLPPGTPPPPMGAFADADTGAVSSVYTSLAEADCRVIEIDEESEGSVSRCPGAAGYALKVLEGDLRQSIDVITPDGKEHPLNYWSVVSGGFSSVGPRAEWRMRGGRPFALIVRVNASENPEDATQITSYLAVARIAPGPVCVTDRIAPTAEANVAARAAADRSAGRPCLSDAP
ncbi:MAG TPA: hypothetical protein VEQ60_13515 [Longimicrobium sp.]|nr:hypothetical protein [Longimicrobium sp.]